MSTKENTALLAVDILVQQLSLLNARLQPELMAKTRPETAVKMALLACKLTELTAAMYEPDVDEIL